MINLYNIDNTDYTKNGNATLEPTRCDFTIGVNEAWSVQVEIPMDDQGKWKLVKKDVMLKIDVDCVREFASTEQLFRVDNYRKEDRTVIINAFSVGMEARHDVLIENYTGKNKTASEVISDFSNFIENNKYNLYTNLSTSGSITLSNSNLISALSYGNDGSFTKVFGGEIVYDNHNIKILNRIGNSVADAHPVIYGKNMTGISYTEDSSGIVTRIYPVSSDGIHLNGTGYIDSEHASDYPYLRKRYMGAPYQLIDDVENPITQTQITTRAALDAVKNSAKQLSYNAMIHAVSAEGDNIPYGAIKKYKSDIIEAVSDMATTHCYHTTLDSKMQAYIKDGINDKLAGMMAVPEPKYSWHGSYEDGWWYGDADTFWSTNKAYKRNEYAYISKKWSYFGNDGTWEAPKDDEGDWDWWQPQFGLADKFKYGNFDRYYAKDEWIYITKNGTLTAYWIDGDGYYDSSYTKASTWTWHGSGTEADPYWFGASDAAGDPDKYAHDQWVFIDGTLYYFDNEGYYDGRTKMDDYQWDWVESGNKYWFGNNEDKTFAAIFLKSQWAKIDSEYYFFDSDGYALDEEEMKIMIIESFLTSMASLLTVVDAQKDILYAKLYELMTSWCEKQYDDNHIDLPSVTISVNMIDLSKTLEYKKYAQLERICLGDAVDCQNPVMNIYSTERIIGLTYDCIRGYNTNIIIGHTEASLGSVLGSSSSGSSVPSGFDTSTIESAITTNSNSIASLQNTKQDKLTAGENITIVNNVISATGGGGHGLEYWIETSTRFYREGTHEGLSADGYIYTSCNWNNYVSGLIQGYEYQKLTEEPAIMAEFGHGLNQAIAIVGLSENAVKWQWRARQATTDWLAMSGYPATMYNVSFTYNGTTWYASVIKVLASDSNTGTVDGLSSIDTTIMPTDDDEGAIYLAKHFIDVENATDEVDVVCEIGTQSYAFKYGGADKTYAYVDTDGNALFKEITTDAGTLTDQMEAKQDNLIAGANIQIGADGKTISATDTTYEEFDGDDAGLVPAVTTQSGKFLKDDGTWATPSGGGSANIVELTQAEYDALPSSKLSDNTLYMVYFDGGQTPDPNYSYYKYGENDEIVVRVYHEGENNEEIVWFFHNFKVNNDKGTGRQAFPTELAQYFTTGSANQSAKMYDTGTQTVRGWMVLSDYLGGTINEYSSNYATVSDWLVDAKVVMGNGTEQNTSYEDPYVYIQDSPPFTKIYYNTHEFTHKVTANPTGTATAILSKMEVDGVIYKMGGSTSYGTATPTADANDGDLYILLDGNNSKQGEYLYMNNAWVQIE